MGVAGGRKGKEVMTQLYYSVKNIKYSEDPEFGVWWASIVFIALYICSCVVSFFPIRNAQPSSLILATPPCPHAHKPTHTVFPIGLLKT